MSKRGDKRRKKRLESSNQSSNQVMNPTLLESVQTDKKTRGKGRRPARLHRTIRLDVQLADAISNLSESWECAESQVIRLLLRQGLELALNQSIEVSQ
jgi:hypothetical protein